MTNDIELTERQQREVEYHKGHARLVREAGGKITYDVLYAKKRRWWNAYWDVFTYVLGLDLRGKNVLVVGCGAGEDAVRLSKLGANVYAFDLSEDMLAIARELADEQNVSVTFEKMPAEKLRYGNDSFDLIFARDIFHHVDIPAALAEIRRVARPGSGIVVNEIYSHSITDSIRHSAFVEKVLYPKMQAGVYGGQKPYITEDERKLSEHDLALITGAMTHVRKKFFNFIVTRLISDNRRAANIADRILLSALGPAASFCGGRVVVIGIIAKYDRTDGQNLPPGSPMPGHGK